MRFNGKLLSAIRFNASNVANATPRCNAYFFFLMLADIMRKNLPREIHWKQAHGLGLVCRDAGEASSETEAGGGKRRKQFK